jgi:transcriptional regulator
MYIPEFNRVEDHEAAVAFMRTNPFVILISNTDAGPFATHLPVVVRGEGERTLIRAHVARANPHWKLLEQEQRGDSLVIFHGPHAYISPSLYENRESVPTWNYAAVHAYGRGKILGSNEEKHQVLAELIAQFDASYLEQWKSLGAQYQSRMLNHIVAFEIAVTRLEAKFKLSQNRTRTEQENVIQALTASDDSAVSGVAELMRQQGLGSR